MVKRQRKAPISQGKGSRATPKKKPSATAPFATALKSFIGHLEGSGKAKHTIASYAFDLQSFAEFIQKSKGAKQVPDLKSLSRKDLERFHEHLRADGQKSNTRRRKLMTVRKLMQYLTSRKKLPLDIARKLPAPEKVERVPMTIQLSDFREKLEALPRESYLACRNAALLAVLMDTGCGVSEVSALRWGSIRLVDSKIYFGGKNERTANLSVKAVGALTKLQTETLRLLGMKSPDDIVDDLCFIGFNRHGPIRIGRKSIGITSRGIEMLVKTTANTLGFQDVTPRVLRHSAVIEWYRAGISAGEIQNRLGLKTPYAFRIYQPIFNAINAGKSSD